MKIYLYGLNEDHNFCINEAEVNETLMLYKSKNNTWLWPSYSKQLRKTDEGQVKCDCSRIYIFFTERNDKEAQKQLQWYYTKQYDKAVLKAKEEHLKVERIKHVKEPVKYEQR